MSEITAETIATNAAKPRAITGDRGSVQQHPIADQIAAAKFRAGQSAMSRTNKGLRMFATTAPGQV